MPTLVAQNMLRRAVGVGDVHSQQQLGWPETGLELAVALSSLHIEKAVAQ